MPRYAILYSYPTWDRHYRGQRGVAVEARDEKHALEIVRAGHGGYPACPGAEIVRCKLSVRAVVAS